MLAVSSAAPASWDFIDETVNGVADVWYMNPGEYPRLTGAGPVSVIRWEPVSKVRVGRTVYEYVYRAEAVNISNSAVYNVGLTLKGWPTNWTIVDGDGHCSSIAAKGHAMTEDTLTIRVDRSAASDSTLVRWQITYQDAASGAMTAMEVMGPGPSGDESAAGDISGDGVVDVEDLAMMAEAWLSTAGSAADLSPVGGDGVVNLQDFAVVAEGWLDE